MADDPYFVTLKPGQGVRRGGESARQRAQEERAKAPVRSVVARMLGVHTDERAWRRGAEGEEKIAAILSRLPKDRWSVFHDLPIGSRGANIDHLVVGPSGVFTLNTKNLTGTVWVAERVLLHNGRKTDYLPKAVREAALASKRLSKSVGRDVAVRAVLVILANRVTVKAQPSDVSVVEGVRLRRWLERQPDVLDRHDAFAVARSTDDLTTWR